MKLLNKRMSMLLGAILSISSVSVMAEPATDLKASVVSKAAESNKGVMVVLTERGDIAVQAAFLLSAQLKQNEGYTPLFLAEEKDKLAAYMKALSLSKASLPAVIFFNKEGKELSRVVSVKPVNPVSYVKLSVLNNSVI